MEQLKSIEKQIFGMNIPTLVTVVSMAVVFTWKTGILVSEVEALKRAPQAVTELEKKVASQEFEVRDIKATIKEMDRRSQESLEISKKVQEELKLVSERTLKLTVEQENQRQERNWDNYNNNNSNNRYNNNNFNNSNNRQRSR